MVELPGIKEPERVRKLLQGSANLEFWETYTAKDVTPYLQAADTKLRAIVASETPTEEADSAATETPAVAQATSTADSLAAALKGENKTQAVDLAQIKKEHPLFATPAGQPQRAKVLLLLMPTTRILLKSTDTFPCRKFRPKCRKTCV